MRRDEIDPFEIADFRRKQKLEDALTEDDQDAIAAACKVECFLCGHVWFQDYVDPSGDIKCPNCGTVETGESFGVAA